MLGDLDGGCDDCDAPDGFGYVSPLSFSVSVKKGMAADGKVKERAKVRRAMENMLQKAAMKILSIVNRDKDHIPPITTSDANPFPYRIIVNPRQDGWGTRIGLY